MQHKICEYSNIWHEWITVRKTRSLPSLSFLSADLPCLDMQPTSDSLSWIISFTVAGHDRTTTSDAFDQGCGAWTQISGSGSSSRYLTFCLRMQHLDVFGSCSSIIFVKLACFTKLYLWNCNRNFKLQLHPLKSFGSRSSHPRLVGLRFHSPAFDFLIISTCSLKTATNDCKCLNVLNSLRTQRFQKNISEHQLACRWTWNKIVKLATFELFLTSRNKVTATWLRCEKVVFGAQQ